MVRVPGEDLFNGHEQRITALELGGGGGDPGGGTATVGPWDINTAPPAWLAHFNDMDLAYMEQQGMISYSWKAALAQIDPGLGGVLSIVSGGDSGAELRVLAPYLQNYAIEVEARLLLRGELPPFLKVGVLGGSTFSEGPGVRLDGIMDGVGGWTPLTYPPLGQWFTVRARLEPGQIVAQRTDGQKGTRNLPNSWRNDYPTGVRAGLMVQMGGAGSALVDYVMVRPVYTEPDRGLGGYVYPAG